jgi:hypothetical protein
MIRLLFVVALLGCSDKRADCIETAREAYMKMHPKMSYSELSTKGKEFERGCPQ